MSKKSPRSPAKSKKPNEVSSPNIEGDDQEIFEYGLKLFNEGGPNNKKEAIRNIKLAADKGNSDAMLKYGLILQSGDGVLANKKKSEEYIKKAADSANYDAMYEYGRICEEKGDVGSMLSAQIYYVKAAADKNPEHCYRCALLFQKNSRGQDNSSEQAENYYKIAADQDYLPAILNYGLLLKKRNKKEAAKYFKSGAEKGDEKCMFHYANALWNGEGCSMDKEEAVKYYKMAADKGEIESMVKYGNALENGEGTTADKKEAFKYYKRAAEAGQSDGMVCYGLLLSSGEIEGVSADKKTALNFFQKAADDGNVAGMHNFARLVLAEGVCGERRDEGLAYLKTAVDKEYPPSLVLYSSLFLNKKDSNYNQNEGVEYLKKAAELGDENAQKIYNDFLETGNMKMPETFVNEKSISHHSTRSVHNQSAPTTSREENNKNSSKCCLIA